MKRIRWVLSAAAAVLILITSGCGQRAETAEYLELRGKGIETVGQDKLINARYIDLRDCALDDISVLAGCEGLEKLDLRGNMLSPGQIEELQEALPDCEILWSVPFAGGVYDSGTKRLTADDENFDPDTLDNLIYFKELEYCDLLGVKELNDEKMGAIQDAMPGTRFLWNVKLGGVSQPSDLKILTIDYGDYGDLSGLRYFKNLKRIIIRKEGMDISIVKELPDLETLDMIYCTPKSFEPLRGLTSLKMLSLRNTGFDDLSIVSGMTGLEYLEILTSTQSDIRFETLDELKGLTSLRNLSIRSMGVRDASALSSLPNLEGLVLSGNPIEDMSWASALTKLEYLDLENTLVTDISFVAGMTRLESAFFGGTDERLAKMGWLPPSVGKCVIEDFTPLTKCPALRQLVIDYTTVSDLSFVEGLDNLETLSLSYDKLGDLTPMTRQRNLYEILMYDSGISKAKQRELRDAMPDTGFEFYLMV